MTSLLRIDYSRVPRISIRKSDEYDDVLSALMEPGPLPEAWPDDCTVDVLTLFKPTDYIHSYPLDLVSEKLKILLEEHGASADFYPVQMIYRRRLWTGPQYFACHIREHLDCYDYARGEYTFYETPGFTDHVDGVQRLAVDEQQAAGHALFRLSKGGEFYILTTDELAADIETQGVTGLYSLSLPSDEIHVMGPPHVPPDEETQRDKVVNVITGLHGPLTDFAIVDEEDTDAPFTVSATSNGDNVKAVFTNGSSDCDLYLPDERHINTDVKLLLPADWPVTDESLNDPRWGWPMRWIHKIVREAHDAFDYDYPTQWPDDLAALFMNGDPPQPLGPNTELCGWVCIHQEEAQYEAPSTYWFDIRLLIPIYREEQQLIESQDIYTFLDRLEERGIPLHIDPSRPNVGLPAG